MNYKQYWNYIIHIILESFSIHVYTCIILYITFCCVINWSVLLVSLLIHHPPCHQLLQSI